MQALHRSAVKGLSAQGIRVQVGARCILEDIGLRVEPGEIVGLLGPNGAGKTTTFRVLTGQIRPDCGEVRLSGELLRGPLHKRVRAGVGYLPQTPSLLEGLSVAQQLHVALEARGASKTEAASFLARVGLEALADRRVELLSGGEARRVEIARCLATDPKILLLDEPFAALDIAARRKLRVFLTTELRTREIPAIVVTHDLRDILALDAQVYVLENGRIAQKGTAQDLARAPSTDFIAEFFQVGLGEASG